MDDDKQMAGRIKLIEMKTKALLRTPCLLLKLHCHISDRQNPEARVVRPRSIGPHSSAEAWNQQWSIHSHSQHDVSTVTLNTKDSPSDSTQSIDRQHKVFTVSGKGIRQPVKPASGVSQYYVTMTSATYHWQPTSNFWFLDFYLPSTVLEDEPHFQSSFAPDKGTSD